MTFIGIPRAYLKKRAVLTFGTILRDDAFKRWPAFGRPLSLAQARVSVAAQWPREYSPQYVPEVLDGRFGFYAGDQVRLRTQDGCRIEAFGKWPPTDAFAALALPYCLTRGSVKEIVVFRLHTRNGLWGGPRR